MIAQGGGRIVNTASTAAIIPRWDIGPYCVSKAGVLHLTRCLALELAQYSIAVNAVGPGATVTNLRQHSGVPEAPGSAGTARRAARWRHGNFSHRRTTRAFRATHRPGACHRLPGL